MYWCVQGSYRIADSRVFERLVDAKAPARTVAAYGFDIAGALTLAVRRSRSSIPGAIALVISGLSAFRRDCGYWEASVCCGCRCADSADRSLRDLDFVDVADALYGITTAQVLLLYVVCALVITVVAVDAYRGGQEWSPLTV